MGFLHLSKKEKPDCICIVLDLHLALSYFCNHNANCLLRYNVTVLFSEGWRSKEIKVILLFFLFYSNVPFFGSVHFRQLLILLSLIEKKTNHSTGDVIGYHKLLHKHIKKISFFTMKFGPAFHGKAILLWTVHQHAGLFESICTAVCNN